MKEPKISQPKSRNYFIRTYLNEVQINNLIKLFNVQHYAYILHDKDDKAPHYHLILRLNTPTTYSAVEKKVKGISAGADNGKDVNYHIDMDCNIQASYRYLTHEDHADKYHYNPNAVVTDDVGYFRGGYSSVGGNEQENVAYQILSCLQEKMSMRDMAKRFGREYIINRKAYNEYLQLMEEEENSRKEMQRIAVYDTLCVKEHNELEPVILRQKGWEEYQGRKRFMQLNSIDYYDDEIRKKARDLKEIEQLCWDMENTLTELVKQKIALKNEKGE